MTLFYSFLRWFYGIIEVDKKYDGGWKMYFVDQKHIKETLKFIDDILMELDQYKYESFIEKFALERMTQLIIESIIDVGNMMIDGFIMRDPGSYEDIIDILVDEEVLPESESDDYKDVIGLREMLVKDYLNIDDDRLKKTILTKKNVVDEFGTHIRNYLKKESEVAHAFSNDK